MSPETPALGSLLALCVAWAAVVAWVQQRFGPRAGLGTLAVFALVVCAGVVAAAGGP